MTILAMALSMALFPAVAGPKSSPAEIQQELMRIELDVVRANERCDRAAFERIEAEEFIFTGPGGKVINKQQDLATLKDCKPTQMNASIEDPILQVHGDVVILNAQITEHPKDKDGNTVTRKYRFTDVFVWRDDRWQMLLGHSSQIREPKPETPAK